MASIKDMRNGTVAELANISAPVFNSKATPTMLANLPAVVVYVESVKGNGHVPTNAFTQNIALQIDVMVTATENWADQADDLVDEVLTALFNSNDWYALFDFVEEYSVDYQIISDGTKPIATAQITISAGAFKAY